MKTPLKDRDSVNGAACSDPQSLRDLDEQSTTSVGVPAMEGSS